MAMYKLCLEVYACVCICVCVCVCVCLRLSLSLSLSLNLEVSENGMTMYKSIPKFHKGLFLDSHIFEFVHQSLRLNVFRVRF
jgi:hypothetical protein